MNAVDLIALRVRHTVAMATVETIADVLERWDLLYQVLEPSPAFLSASRARAVELIARSERHVALAVAHG